MAIQREHGLEVIRKSGEEVTPNNNTDYYLKVRNPVGLPLDINGQVVFTGLSIGIRTSTIQVSDVVTALPAVAFASRNSLLLRNLSDTEVLYLGDATVTAGRTVGSTTNGLEVDSNQEFSVDIASGLTLYGIAPSGKTIIVKITEFA